MESIKLELRVNDSWTNTEKGSFFEQFIAQLITPMGYTVVQQVRFTGIEIDLLASHDITKQVVFIECKAYQDNMPADIITKLLGNISLRKASAGWLFSTSDFGKDGRGIWEDVQKDQELISRIIWYSPDKIIDLLIRQGKVKHYQYIKALFPNLVIGSGKLLICPQGNYWVIDVIEDSIPHFNIWVNAENGIAITKDDYGKIVKEIQLDNKLEFYEPKLLASYKTDNQVSKVARVLSGDSWDDPRPARPQDFIGRDSLIETIISFVDSIRQGLSNSRIFTVEGPSGWGKSSLMLKTADILNTQKEKNIQFQYLIRDLQ